MSIGSIREDFLNFRVALKDADKDSSLSNCILSGEKRVTADKVMKFVREAVREKCGFLGEDREKHEFQVKDVTKLILRNCGVKRKKELLCVETARKVLKAVDTDILAVGSGIDIYKHEKKILKGETKKFLEWALEGGSLSEAMNWRLFRAGFVRSDQEFLKEVRGELLKILYSCFGEITGNRIDPGSLAGLSADQIVLREALIEQLRRGDLSQANQIEFEKILDRSCKQLGGNGVEKEPGSPSKKQPLSKGELLLHRALIDQLLTMLPYFAPEEGEKIVIPQETEAGWKLVNFQVKRIPLSEGKWDNVFYAYLLEPISKEERGKPIMLYSGTPMSTASGAKIAHWSDYVPGSSVGEKLHEMSIKRVKEEVDRVSKEHGGPVYAYGSSLGGSMTMMLEAECPDKVVGCGFNSPGFFSRMSKKYKDKGEKSNKNSIIYCNYYDPAFSVGQHPKVNLHCFVPLNRQSSYRSHVSSFAAWEKVVVVKLDREKENARGDRKVRTTAFQVFSAPLFLANSFDMLWNKLMTEVGRLGQKGIDKISWPNVKKLAEFLFYAPYHLIDVVLKIAATCLIYISKMCYQIFSDLLELFIGIRRKVRQRVFV